MESEDDHHRQQNSSPRISKGERKDVTKRESVECDKCEKQMNTFEKELNLSAKKSCTDTLDPEENVHLQIIQPLLNVNTTENINSPSNESSVKEGKKEEETVLVPPDGGWGWLVAIGAFIITMLLPSVGPCFGILFSGFLLENDVSSTTTSWIFNIQMMFWHLMGPAVHPLTLEFGWRKVGAFGIILTASAVTVSAFIPSPAFLFFSFSFISGIGNGLAITMSVIIVPQYFDKKRGLSNSILMSGISFGQITSAPLARYLLDVYGFKGAALIFGAVLLHGLIGVSFFQPVEWHMKRKTVARREPEILASSCIEKDDETCNENLHLHHKTNDSIANNHSSNDAHGSTELTKDAKGKRSCKSAVVLIDIIIRVARSTISDIKIVRMLRVRICCGALALCIIGYMNYLMQIPFAMQAADFSLQEASWCISVFGMSNMVTRLVLSALSDLPKFDLRLFLMIGYFLAAVSMFVFPFLTNFTLMMIVMIVMGCGIGANMALNSLVMIKYMGIANLPPTLGVASLTVAISCVTLGPLVGVVRDLTNSYSFSMWILAAMLAGSFCLWLFMPAALRIDAEKDNQKRSKDLIQNENTRV